MIGAMIIILGVLGLALVGVWATIKALVLEPLIFAVAAVVCFISGLISLMSGNPAVLLVPIIMFALTGLGTIVQWLWTPRSQRPWFWTDYWMRF